MEKKPTNWKMIMMGVMLGVAALGLILGMIQPFFDTEQAPEKEKAEPTEEVVAEVEEPEEAVEAYKSKIPVALLEDEEVLTFLKDNEVPLNGLAVGFTTMATFLDFPEAVENIEEIQQEILFTEQAYAEIFSTIKATAGGENLAQFTDILENAYTQLYAYRKMQAENLKTIDGVTQIEENGFTQTEVKQLWEEVVAMHNDFNTVTGSDYTGGLGTLMR